MRAPAVPTARTSLRESYWPWSISPSTMSLVRRAEAVTRRPTSRSSSGRSQSTCLGPAMATVRVLATTARSSARQVGSGAESSWRSHIHEPGVGPSAGSSDWARASARVMGERAPRGGVLGPLSPGRSPLSLIEPPMERGPRARRRSPAATSSA